jgi:hypothetical protein
MSQNNEELSFVDKIDDSVSTDHVTDLKSGIFNLFVSLYQHLSLDIGPKNAMLYSTKYLSEIIDTFNSTVENTEPDTNQN